MADKYWGKVAELTGLLHCPKEGPYGQGDGAVMGVRSGYIVAIGPAKDGKVASVKIMVRFPKNLTSPPIKAALGNSPALAAALEVGSVGEKELKNVSVLTDGVIWKWTYSWAKPKPEKVAAVAIAMVDALKGVAPDFQGKCEDCRSAGVSEVLLKNKLPVFYCSGCQFKAQAASQEVLRQYEAQESNLFLGLIYGCVAAALGAIAWGGVAVLANRIFLWGGVLIGYMVAWAVIKGMGRINLAGQIAIGVLTVASVIAGDFVFYTGAVVMHNNVPLS